MKLTWPTTLRADLGLEKRYPDLQAYLTVLFPVTSFLYASGGSRLRAPSEPSPWAQGLDWAQGMFMTEQSSRCCTFLVGSDLPPGTQGISFSEEPQIFLELPSSWPALEAGRFRSAC